MGAFCCVAARPHGETSEKAGRDNSMDLVEPHWRTNSSFSPPRPSRIWDCRLQTDDVVNAPEVSFHATLVSSNSKGSRRTFGCGRNTSHQHSVSDGILPFSESPPDNVNALRWTSPAQNFNLDTPSIGGSRHKTACLPHSTERRFLASASAASCSFGSPSSLSESGPSGKQPSIIFPSRNFSSRRSFMSKPVYPLVIHNPVSGYETNGDTDTSSIGRSTPGNDISLPSHWPDNSPIIEHKFHRNLTELQEADTSSLSSRREGSRWSNASSYDMRFHEEHSDVSENMDLESLRSPDYNMRGPKCGICIKFLWQKSPWDSNRIVRSGDPPIASILACSHVFHAECLEQVTPKPQIHDPSCPLCLKAKGVSDNSPSASEPLVMALRSARRRRRGVIVSDAQENSSIDEVSSYTKDSTMKTSSGAGSQQNGSGAFLKNQFKKHLSFKGKMPKDFFSTKFFHRARSSSSSSGPVKIQSELN